VRRHQATYRTAVPDACRCSTDERLSGRVSKCEASIADGQGCARRDGDQARSVAVDQRPENGAVTTGAPVSVPITRPATPRLNPRPLCN
jgi:hypothetical protein